MDKSTDEDIGAVQDRLTWAPNDIVFEQRIDPRNEMPAYLTRQAMAKRASNAIERAIGDGSRVLRPFESNDGVRFAPE
jgi:hypothetical protein